MPSITCGNCGQTHESVADVRACHQNTLEKSSTLGERMQSYGTTTATATQKQIDFVKRLQAELGVDGPVVGANTTRAQASSIIEDLLKRKGEGSQKPAPTRTNLSWDNGKGRADTSIDREDGIYVVDGDGDSKIYKVYQTQRGISCVKQLAIDWDLVNDKSGEEPGHNPAEWQYLGRTDRHLPAAARKMSIDEAKQFGKIYGFCVRCGRTLTDETSIAEGIGPVCAGKW